MSMFKRITSDLRWVTSDVEMDKRYREAVALHEVNLPEIERRTELRSRITVLMREAGIQDNYKREAPCSRARFPKMVDGKAGYLVDLDRFLPVDDGFAAIDRDYQYRVSQREVEASKKADEREKQRAQREREQEEYERKRRSDLDLVRLIAKYELAEYSEWSEVLDHLRSKSKYIDLAFAMADTRSDWSEGYWRVEAALSRFTVQTDIDQKIYDDVSDACSLSEDFVDGRVFRNCTWNYSRILSDISIDPDLLADANRAHEEASSW